MIIIIIILYNHIQSKKLKKIQLGVKVNWLMFCGEPVQKGQRLVQVGCHTSDSSLRGLRMRGDELEVEGEWEGVLWCECHGERCCEDDVLCPSLFPGYRLSRYWSLVMTSEPCNISGLKIFIMWIAIITTWFEVCYYDCLAWNDVILARLCDT